MDIEDEQRLSAPPETVWKLLNDPAVLRECIPGCESLEMNGDAMEATVGVKIGPIKARFLGVVQLIDLHPPASYAIVGEGKGGVAGFAKGRADVSLRSEGDVTVLKYKVNVQIGGKLAQLGSRLIVSTSKKLTQEFFGSFARKVSEAMTV